MHLGTILSAPQTILTSNKLQNMSFLRRIKRILKKDFQDQCLQGDVDIYPQMDSFVTRLKVHQMQLILIIRIKLSNKENK